MAQPSVKDIKLKLRGYRYADATARDIHALISNFKSLKPQDPKRFVHSNGTVENLASVYGTIPVKVRASTYNIPLTFWLRLTHPYHPPKVYVTPTADMGIHQSRFVDASGMVYLPYLDEWKHGQSDLTVLAQILCATFGDNCPVFSKRAVQQPLPWQQYQRPPQPPTTYQSPYLGYPPQPRPPYPGSYSPYFRLPPPTSSIATAGLAGDAAAISGEEVERNKRKSSSTTTTVGQYPGMYSPRQPPMPTPPTYSYPGSYPPHPSHLPPTSSIATAGLAGDATAISGEEVERNKRKSSSTTTTVDEEERPQLQETISTQRSVELAQTQPLTTTELGHTIQQLSLHSEELAQTKQELTQKGEELAQTKQELTQKDEELAQTQQQVRQLQSRLSAADAEIQQLRSHFWLIPQEEVQVLPDKCLGRGGWGYVTEGTVKVAVKHIYPDLVTPRNRDRIRREIRTMAQVRHPNLVSFVGAVLDDQHGHMIITEILDTNLREAYEQNRLGTNNNKLHIFHDVANALKYLHERPDPIIHRDVSTKNVLLKRLPNNAWRAKLTDFGSANLASLANTLGEGAIVYTAPEAYPHPPDSPNPPPPQTSKIDVYSYGVLLGEVITCQFPDHTNRKAMFDQVQHQWPALHPLVCACVKYDPNDRPTMAYVLNELESLL